MPNVILLFENVLYFYPTGQHAIDAIARAARTRFFSSQKSPRRHATSHNPRQRKMILTNCAACAAPLASDHKKRCSRCKTRYCNEACQRQHWERGGHEALCRRIKRGGGAEQYYADKKYNEAVAAAVEACAADTSSRNAVRSQQLRGYPSQTTALRRSQGAASQTDYRS